MKDRPILYSGPMVRAILAGSKRKTRRVVKPQPEAEHDGEPYWYIGGYRAHEYRATRDVLRKGGKLLPCPYGQPGEKLWVRENGWERPERTPKMMREGADTWEPYYFDADGLTEQDSADFKAFGFKRRPSIHMPRWASRITLEITGVRVERLQDISEADALAEGIVPTFGGYGLPNGSHFHAADPRVSYWSLWESINGVGSVEANPWVWDIEFKRIEGKA